MPKVVKIVTCEEQCVEDGTSNEYCNYPPYYSCAFFLFLVNFILHKSCYHHKKGDSYHYNDNNSPYNCPKNFK